METEAVCCACAAPRRLHRECLELERLTQMLGTYQFIKVLGVILFRLEACGRTGRPPDTSCRETDASQGASDQRALLRNAGITVKLPICEITGVRMSRPFAGAAWLVSLHAPVRWSPPICMYGKEATIQGYSETSPTGATSTLTPQTHAPRHPCGEDQGPWSRAQAAGDSGYLQGLLGVDRALPPLVQ